jgi:hypothetical protein
MLLRETAAVYCENNTEHINTLCEQNADILHVKSDVTHSGPETCEEGIINNHLVAAGTWNNFMTTCCLSETYLSVRHSLSRKPQEKKALWIQRDLQYRESVSHRTLNTESSNL